MASRTLLFDQQRLAWSAEMLALAGLTAEQLPEPRPGGTQTGRLSAEAAAATGLTAGTPCILGGHDHLCAAFAAGAYAAGSVVDSCGTAEAVLAVVPGFHSSAFIAEAGYACYAHVLPGHYILKGGLKAAGGAVEWLARQLAGPVPPASCPMRSSRPRPGRGSAGGPGRSGCLHLIGAGTPEGDRHSMAALVGARAEHNQGDLFRGLLESLAFWLRQNMEAIQDLTGLAAGEVILLGGTVRLHLLAQLKAEVLGQPVTVPRAARSRGDRRRPAGGPRHRRVCRPGRSRGLLALRPDDHQARCRPHRVVQSPVSRGIPAALCGPADNQPLSCSHRHHHKTHETMAITAAGTGPDP